MEPEPQPRILVVEDEKSISLIVRRLLESKLACEIKVADCCDAARRELCEETGLIWEGEMVPVGAFGNPGRDPRGWNVSAVFLADIGFETPMVVGGDDAADARWCFADDLPKEMAFDHVEIVRVALVRLGCV